MDLKPLHASIRKAAPEHLWSAGVRLYRAGRVVFESEDEDELRFSVTNPGRVALTVYLWPKDKDWGCDCGREICIHAVAVSIAAMRRATGEEQPSTPARRKTLHYNLVKMGKSLRLDREISEGQTRTPFHGKIRSLQGVHLTKADFVVEEVLQLGNTKIPNVGWQRILKAWEADASKVSLSGRPMSISCIPVGDVVRVTEQDHGFRVGLVRNTRIEEAFGGVVRVGETLHPKGESPLESHQRSALVRGVFFDQGEAGRLVADFLPKLREKVEVEVRTTKLPEQIEAHKPRLLAQMQAHETGLQVLVDVVYGDPPIGRVRRGKLELFGHSIPVRDEKEEARLIKSAQHALKLPIGQAWRMPPEEAAEWVRDRLPRWKGDVQGGPGPFQYRKREVGLQIEQRDGGVHLNSEADPEALVRAWREGRTLVPLQTGGWAPLPKDFLDKHGHILADLFEARNPDGSLPRHATLALAEIAAALDSPAPPDFKKLKPLLRDFTKLPQAAAPKTLNGELRSYQRTGLNWMTFLSKARLGGILADDMGLGKTLQTLCLLNNIKGRHLVVAPTSVLHNWKSESSKFFPSSRVCLYHGPQRKLDKSADLVLTSYALMRLDPVICKTSWKTVILDESQAIKNPESQTAQAAFELKAQHRFALTGTPVENRLEELWSQFHFVMPGYLGGKKHFIESYSKPIESGEATAAETLRRRIKPFILRRLKGEVAPELPPLTQLVMRCSMPDEQRDIYKVVHQAARTALQSDTELRTLQVLEHLLRLRQAACDPRLLPGNHPPVSGKTELLLQKLAMVVEKGHKALVFSQWTGFLDIISQEMQKAEIDHLRLDGMTKDRQSVVAEFQSEQGPPVFLISLKAGGTGLNLTAADYVFIVDPWWNPAVEAQATDRAHRIGQTKPVIAVRLISEDSVEERIIALQNAKRELAEAAIGGAEAFAGKLTREELLAMFQ
ncbi:MAG: DEAD/DEAH box helicase [Myxococcota bacterium]|nr:DEAD/DEAH box helicase [Myxococcota bacterium]